MTITAKDLEQLADLCALFVQRGLTFTSDANALVITLSGGY